MRFTSTFNELSKNYMSKKYGTVMSKSKAQYCSKSNTLLIIFDFLRI